MPRQRTDIGSKWLLHNQARGVFLVGGIKGVRRYQAMPGEIAQSRKYPDGLLQVFLEGETKPHHVLIEVATYPEKRALQQALDDLAVAYTALNQLPELLMLVLRPKGRFRIEGRHQVRSKLGLSSLATTWRVVDLWTLPAEDYLAAGDVSVVPWVPLMRFDGPPEALLERCAEKVEREAHPQDRADLLAVSQVIAELRFPSPELLGILGGEKAMIESPLLKKMIADELHDGIHEVLKARFGPVPRDVTRLVREVLDRRRLKKLIGVAAKCTDLQAFREALLA